MIDIIVRYREKTIKRVFFFEKNDNLFVYSSKTFISINNLINIIDLKLNQTIQSLINE